MDGSCWLRGCYFICFQLSEDGTRLCAAVCLDLLIVGVEPLHELLGRTGAGCLAGEAHLVAMLCCRVGLAWGMAAGGCLPTMPAKSIQFFGREGQGNRLLIYIHWVVTPVAVALVDVVGYGGSAANAAGIQEAGELACVAGEYTDLAEVACVADDLVGVADAEAAEIHDEGGHLAWGWNAVLAGDAGCAGCLSLLGLIRPSIFVTATT